MNVTLHNSTNNAAYEIRSSNDWMADAKRREMPRRLIGELWRERELAVLYGDPGSAKSVFAMQVAETLARGGSFAPFSSRVDARPVVYIDTMSNDKQFESRYAADHEGGRARFLHKHYKFAEILTRVEYDLGSLVLEKGTTPADVFCRDLRQIVAETGTKTIIVDSLNGLLTSYYGNRQLTDLLIGLRRLRKELDLSILVVVQTATHRTAAPLGMGTVLFRAISCRTDSIFGMGRDHSQSGRVYLKQAMSRSGAMINDEAHVPVFTVQKENGNFLSLELSEYLPETELLENVRTLREWDTIERIKELTDAGRSLREIATGLSMAKTTVHKLLSMWRPLLPQPADTALAEYAAALPKFVEHFPGCTAYHDAKQDERFVNLDERRSDHAILRREQYSIDVAHYRAQKEYEKTGVAPPFDEMMASLLEEDAQREEAAHQRQLDGEYGLDQDIPPPEVVAREIVPGVTSPLTVATDAYGHTIYIESTTETGKPKIWYKRHRQGGFTKHTRDFAGIILDRIRPEMALEE